MHREDLEVKKLKKELGIANNSTEHLNLDSIAETTKTIFHTTIKD